MEILPQILANSLISGSIYALAGAGIALTYALFRILNFSHGHLMMVGAYTYYFFCVDLGLPPSISFLFTCIVGMFLSEISLRIFVNPFLTCNALLPFVSTLALSVVLESVISIIFGVNVRTLTLASWGESFELLNVDFTYWGLLCLVSAIFGIVGLIAVLLYERTSFRAALYTYVTLILGMFLISFDSELYQVVPVGLQGALFHIPGFFITHFQVFIILSALVVLSVLAFIVHATSIGRTMRAAAEASDCAVSIGINIRRFSSWAFLACVILANFSGILVGYETNIQPTMGSSYTIKAFAAMILGGLGNIWGTIAGSYILGFVENLSIGIDIGGYSLPSGYKDAFSFLIILCILLFRPRGLFNTSARSI